MNSQYRLDCHAYSYNDDDEWPIIEYRQCTNAELTQHKLSPGDHIAIENIAAGYAALITVLNSRSLEGAPQLFVDNKDYIQARQKSGEKTSDLPSYARLAAIETLLSNSKFSQLRDAQGLENLVRMGIDSIAAVRLAQTMHREICPAGVKTSGSRPGYLFASGICLEEANSSNKTTVEKALAIAELALQGGLSNINIRDRDDAVTDTYIIKPVALLTSPVENLQSLGLEFDTCGRLKTIADQSVGGLFPNNDANQVLQKYREAQGPIRSHNDGLGLEFCE